MSISQEMTFRMKVIKYAKHFNVLRAAAQYKVSASSIYRWIKLYDDSGGDIEVLRNKPRRPQSHPNAHTTAEIKLITDIRRRNSNIGLQDLWNKLRKRGYARSLSGLYKQLIVLNLMTRPQTKHSPTCYKPKPYEKMDYPGERVQIDVKYVPRECLAPTFVEKYQTDRLYQYTAIDEYSRYRVLWCSLERNTYESALFLTHAVRAFRLLGIEVECVQTDNGFEFTKQFVAKDENNHSMFEVTARQLDIKIKRIRPGTPRHNGKVERSHREDQRRLYSEMIRLGHFITSLESFQRKLKRYQHESNNRPMRPLGYKAPMQMIKEYQRQHLKNKNEA